MSEAQIPRPLRVRGLIGFLPPLPASRDKRARSPRLLVATLANAHARERSPTRVGRKVPHYRFALTKGVNFASTGFHARATTCKASLTCRECPLREVPPEARDRRGDRPRGRLDTIAHRARLAVVPD